MGDRIDLKCDYCGDEYHGLKIYAPKTGGKCPSCGKGVMCRKGSGGWS